jgi:PAS domain-containing protein
VGSRLLDDIAVDQIDGLNKRIRSLTPDNPLAVTEFCLNTEDDSKRWEVWTNRGIFDTDGKLIEIQAVGRDITERKRALEELQMFNELMLDREERIIDLKEEVNNLAAQLGQKAHYPPVWETNVKDL